jgi:hypothetical protein
MPCFEKKYLLSLVAFMLVAACSSGDPDEARTVNKDSAMLTTAGASRFANLALDCIHREYPNKLGQVLQDESRLLPPKTLHPAFYGCFDWHSSVHGHWMLTKLLRDFPELPERQQIIDGLSKSLSAANIAGEVEYFATASGSWERTYGWAWLLQLGVPATSGVPRTYGRPPKHCIRAVVRLRLCDSR